MLAKSRIDSDNGRMRYDITAIGTSRSSSGTGMPFGAKKVKKYQPCRISAMTVTPTKMKAARAKVTAMWLVKVKLYGTMPMRLPNSTNMKSEKTKGKYALPALPTFSRTMLAMNS